MRDSITILVLSLLMVTLSAVSCFSRGTAAEPLGFPSEDWGGGSYLGVDTRDITPDRLGPLHLKEERGVEVTMVDQDAPAGKAGLKEQDVILTLNGTEVESVEQFRRMIRETPPGRVVTLGISRSGQPLTIKVQLADRKNSFSYNFNPNNFKVEIPPIPPLPDIDVPVSIVVVHSSLRSGLMVENLTQQLGDFFGAKDGNGVLVRSVEKNSRADKAGFRAGDVIVKINGEPIHDAGDFSHALRSRKDNTASITVIRDRKEQTLTLTLPERKQSDIFRESLNMPDIDAESLSQELSEAQSEMALLKPEMMNAINREIESMKPEFARQAQAMSKQACEIKKQMREMQREIQDHQRELQRELREEMRNYDDRI